MEAQVVVIRETAESEINALRETAAQQLALVREQVDASTEQNQTLREMTSAQLRPIVLTKAFSGWIRGPNKEFELGRRQAAVPYFLANEGTGVALHIQHGVNIDGVVIASGYGDAIYAIRPGESAPPAKDTRVRQSGELLLASVHEDEVPGDWTKLPLTYWVKYQNVFGEQFESSTEISPRQLQELPSVSPTGDRA